MVFCRTGDQTCESYFRSCRDYLAHATYSVKTQEGKKRLMEDLWMWAFKRTFVMYGEEEGSKT